MRLAVPAIFLNVFSRMMDVANIAFLGHYQGQKDELTSGSNDGSAFLAGIGLGNVCNHLMGLTIILGMNSALDTLIS